MNINYKSFECYRVSLGVTYFKVLNFLPPTFQSGNPIPPIAMLYVIGFSVFFEKLYEVPVMYEDGRMVECL